MTAAVALSLSEKRALAALRLADRVAAEEYADAPASMFPEGVPNRYLHDFKSVYRAARVNEMAGRNPQERHIYDALQSLVTRGLVEKTTASGMGGGFTLYIVKEEA